MWRTDTDIAGGEIGWATDRDRAGHEIWMEVANRNRKRPQAHSVTITRVICDRDLANLKSAVAAVDLAHRHTYGITERFGLGTGSCYNQAATLNSELIFVER
jgi:hypothetical protein